MPNIHNTPHLSFGFLSFFPATTECGQGRALGLCLWRVRRSAERHLYMYIYVCMYIHTTRCHLLYACYVHVFSNMHVHLCTERHFFHKRVQTRKSCRLVARERRSVETHIYMYVRMYVYRYIRRHATCWGCVTYMCV